MVPWRRPLNLNGADGITTTTRSQESPPRAPSDDARLDARLEPPSPPWLALSVATFACLAYLAAELYVFGRLALPLDDGWIHLQFAHQLASGHGLTYNDPIEGSRWITGSTAPLWTALVALTFIAPGSPLIWTKVLGIVCFLGTVYATDRLAGELGVSRGLCRLAALLVAATYWLVWSALSGLEIAFFACLSLWGIVLHLRERDAEQKVPTSLAVLAAATLARPEGSLLLLLAIVDRWLRFDRSPPEKASDADELEISPGLSRSVWSTGLPAAAVILIPTCLFNLVVGGSVLPTTFAVKAGAPPDLIPSGRYLGTVLDILFKSQPIMLLAAGAGVLRLITRLGGPRDRGLLPALWPIGLALAYSFLASPVGAPPVGNFGRYYFPLLPVVVVLGVLGLQDAGRRLGPSVRLTLGKSGLRAPLRGLLIVAILAPQLWALGHGPQRYIQTLSNVEDSDVAAARWLADRLPAEALLAVQDIGALKYHLPNRIVDLAGIVNPEILPYLHGSGPQDPVYWEQRLFGYLSEARPDYLVVFTRSYPWLTSAAPGFEKIQSFEVRGNVTMAGDELAIFATPWNRFPLIEPQSD